MYESEKIHWKRRSTIANEKAKVNCLFDRLVTIGIILYLIGGAVWIMNDAFPHLFF